MRLDERRDGKRLVGQDNWFADVRIVVVFKQRRMGVGERIIGATNGADGVGDGGRGGCGGRAVKVCLVPRMIFGKVRRKIADKRVKRLGAEELKSILPLLCTDKSRVGNDLEGGRLKRLVQLTKALLPPVSQKAVKFIGGARIVGDLVNVVVEGFRILDRRGKCVVAVVQRREQVVLGQAKLPVRPSPPRIIHPLLAVGRKSAVKTVEVEVLRVRKIGVSLDKRGLKSKVVC